MVLFIQDSFILEETHPSGERRPYRPVQEGHLDASLGGQAVFQALADRFDIVHLGYVAVEEVNLAQKTLCWEKKVP